MNPAALGAFGIGSTIAGGGISAFSALQGGKAQAGAYRYQAGISRANAGIFKQNAEYERQVGGVQAERAGLKSRFEIGKIRAAQSASGIDMTRGSAADVVEGQQKIASHDQRLIRHNAARRAYGQEVEAWNAEEQARMQEISASNAEKSGKLKALASIIGTAGSVSSKWLAGRDSGLWATKSKGASSIHIDDLVYG